MRSKFKYPVGNFKKKKKKFNIRLVKHRPMEDVKDTNACMHALFSNYPFCRDFIGNTNFKPCLMGLAPKKF